MLLLLSDSVIVLYFVTLSPFFFCDHLDEEERELDTLLSLSSWCLMPWVCLQFVNVIFPDHTDLLFLGVTHANSDGFDESEHLLGLV